MKGKFTIESFAKEKGITIQSALNLLSKLKREGFVNVSGGGKQKRIYTLSEVKIQKPNGFFNIVNKYSPEKLVPKFEHFVYGKYTIENAIIDGIKIGDQRTLNATKYLFNHIKDWKKLMELAKREDRVTKVIELYNLARKTNKCRKMPRRYQK